MKNVSTQQISNQLTISFLSLELIDGDGKGMRDDF